MNSAIQEIKQKARPILKRHGVKRASLFGSYVRGEQKKHSDIDILIHYPKRHTKSLLDLIGLEHELKTVLGKKVDLVTPGALNQYLKDGILNSCQTIYEED